MPSNTAGESTASGVTTERRDADIVRYIGDGNPTQAFELIMQRYEAKVYRLCVAYLRNPVHAQDAAQESLVRLWRALPKYDGRASLSTWIYAITRNWCLSCLSKRPSPLSLSEAAVEAEAASLAIADRQEGLDQNHTIRQLVAELPEMTRRIVTLYYFEEQSVVEVSEQVGLPEGTIKTHLFRARARLAARLESLGLADPARWIAVGDRYGQ
ncbi:MAG: sigma-70 family RNA polymerase sigma factor [Steroidobacteraceae bacterium]